MSVAATHLLKEPNHIKGDHLLGPLLQVDNKKGTPKGQGNDNFCDTTERASQRLTPQTRRFPEVGIKSANDPMGQIGAIRLHVLGYRSLSLRLCACK